MSGQGALRDAQARLTLLRIPAQTSQRELQDALAALDRANTSDPAVQDARQHVSAALAAVGGSGLQTAQAGGFPGLDAALANELALAEAAGRQIDAAVRQAGQFADVMQQVADGAGRLVNPGLTTIRQPIAEIGHTMADLLVRRIAGEEPTRITILPVDLIRRDTA